MNANCKITLKVTNHHQKFSKKIAKNDIYVTWKGTSFVVLYVIIYCGWYLYLEVYSFSYFYTMTYRKIFLSLFCYVFLRKIRTSGAEFWLRILLCEKKMMRCQVSQNIYGRWENLEISSKIRIYNIGKTHLIYTFNIHIDKTTTAKITDVSSNIIIAWKANRICRRKWTLAVSLWVVHVRCKGIMMNIIVIIVAWEVIFTVVGVM